MNRTGSAFLIAGAILSAGAALLHLGCIAFGARWYRFLGAGERMLRMVSAGRAYPTVVTLAVAAVLLLGSLYALSGAGVIGRLPFLRSTLCAIAGIYLLRAVAFAPLMKLVPGNSLKFWLVSSTLCLVFGAVHLIGIRLMWDHL